MRLSAQSLLKLVADMQEQEAVEFLRSEKKIIRDAPMPELIASAHVAPDAMSRQILSKILGRRCEPSAVPVLLEYLTDPSAAVRREAADAIGRLGDSGAGPALFAQFLIEDDRSARHTLVSALAAVGYAPAIPIWLQLLDDPDWNFAEAAAWSLGLMGVVEAEDGLRRTLDQPRASEFAYLRGAIQDALTTIAVIAAAGAAPDARSAESLLISALQSPSNTMRGAAAVMLGAVGGEASARALQDAAAHEDSCFVAVRMQSALAAIHQATP